MKLLGRRFYIKAGLAIGGAAFAGAFLGVTIGPCL